MNNIKTINMKYECKLCKYITSEKKSYKSHRRTDKHKYMKHIHRQKKLNDEFNNTNNQQLIKLNDCDNYNKTKKLTTDKLEYYKNENEKHKKILLDTSIMLEKTVNAITYFITNRKDIC